MPQRRFHKRRCRYVGHRGVRQVEHQTKAVQQRSRLLQRLHRNRPLYLGRCRFVVFLVGVFIYRLFRVVVRILDVIEIQIIRVLIILVVQVIRVRVAVQLPVQLVLACLIRRSIGGLACCVRALVRSLHPIQPLFLARLPARFLAQRSRLVHLLRRLVPS